MEINDTDRKKNIFLFMANPTYTINCELGNPISTFKTQFSYYSLTFCFRITERVFVQCIQYNTQTDRTRRLIAVYAALTSIRALTYAPFAPSRLAFVISRCI